MLFHRAIIMLKRAGSFFWRTSSTGLNRTVICNKRNCHHEGENSTVKVESLVVKRNRLQYQSRKRGMLENCILFSTFSEKFLASLTPIQLEQYDSLLNGPSNDWDIYYWATGLRETPAEYKNEIMDLFSEHVKNYEKQPRSLLPKLLSDT